jgi:hypothetical protein
MPRRYEGPHLEVTASNQRGAAGVHPPPACHGAWPQAYSSIPAITVFPIDRRLKAVIRLLVFN